MILQVASSAQAANLERSLQLLDSALGSPAAQLNVSNFELTRAVEVTRAVDFLDASAGRVRPRHSLDITRALNRSLTTSNIMAAGGLLEENPGVAATETLFDEFLTTVSAASAASASGSVESCLDSIAEFEQTVADHVDVLR